MTIKANIENVQRRILDGDGDSAFADELKAQAVNAIYAGIGSTQWETFMRNFATNDIELARLTTRRPQDDLCDRYIGLARSYLVANITCTPATGNNFLLGVNDILDMSLPQQPPPQPPNN